jgi:predicted RNA-binding protein YlqC (UPF0109 family)
MIWVVGIGLGLANVLLLLIYLDVGRVIGNTYATIEAIREMRYALKPERNWHKDPP